MHIVFFLCQDMADRIIDRLQHLLVCLLQLFQSVHGLLQRVICRVDLCQISFFIFQYGLGCLQRIPQRLRA